MRTLGRMWCAVHSCDDRDISAKTYRCNTTSVSLRATASPQGEAFGTRQPQVEPSYLLCQTIFYNSAESGRYGFSVPNVRQAGNSRKPKGFSQQETPRQKPNGFFQNRKKPRRRKRKRKIKMKRIYKKERVERKKSPSGSAAHPPRRTERADGSCSRIKGTFARGTAGKEPSGRKCLACQRKSAIASDR